MVAAVTRPDVPDVPESFDAVAHRYDLMVGLSPGYHRQLRSSAQHLVAAVLDERDIERAAEAYEQAPPVDPADASLAPAPRDPDDPAEPPRPVHLLDLGCGSGASTRALVEVVRARTGADGAGVTVLGVDGSEGMLASARRKTWPAWVRFARGRAESLPSQPELADARAAGGLDGVLAAYLVRNVPDRDVLLRSLHDDLRPGGVLVVHEYSVRGRPLATVLWTLVCWAVIVPLGWLTSRHTDIYRYLWRSVLDMDSTARLEQRLRDAGFEHVRTHPVPGWQRGTVHSVVGRRPVR